jgi:hypothetical protein
VLPGTVAITLGARRKSKSQPSSALRNRCEEQLAIAARIRVRLARRQRGKPRGELLIGQQQFDRTLLHGEPHPVAAAHDCERAAERRFGRHVQHDRAGRGAAHAAVRDAHHVLHAFACELARNRNIAGLRHARRADWSDPLQHERVLCGDVERGVVDAAREVFRIFEDDRAPFMLHQLRIRRRPLDDRAARREIAAQHRDPALRIDRLRERPYHVLREARRRRVELFAKRAAGDRQPSRCSRSFNSRITVASPPARCRSSI